jgi:RluA family pseudouridine synthase
MDKRSVKWVVSFKEEGMRLVNYIKLKSGSKSSLRQIKSNLEKGICKVNNLVESFASKKLRKGDLVQIEKKEELAEKNIVERAPKILYEDEYFIVVDKKVGFLSSDAEVQKYFPQAILVHRLDRQTSGVLILAKSKKAKDKMEDLFREKKVYKTYIAVVDGKVDEKKIKRESFLVKRKDIEGKILWKETRKDGLYASSIFETFRARKLYSVLRCFPITGRTHQLRVHLLNLGHPILGDYQYCRDFKYPKYISRLMLHSYQIEFKHPFLEKKISVSSHLPKDFQKFYGNKS